MTKNPIAGMDNISTIGRNLRSNRFSLQAVKMGVKNAPFITFQDEITFPSEEVARSISKSQEQSIIAVFLSYCFNEYTSCTLCATNDIKVFVILLALNPGELYPYLNFGIAPNSYKTPYSISSYQVEQSLQCPSLILWNWVGIVLRSFSQKY